MAACFYRNELLCFVANKYGNSPNESVKSVILNFYTPTEISGAKELIFKAVNELNLTVDWVPRQVNRRRSEDKPRLEIDDIYAVFDAFDEHVQLNILPEFVAKDLERLPPFRTDELDLCMAVRRISALESKVSSIVSNCVEMVSANVKANFSANDFPKFNNTSANSAQNMSMITAVNTMSEIDTGNKTLSDIQISEPDIHHDHATSACWSEGTANVNASDFTLVTNKRRVKPKTPPRVTVLKGTKTGTSNEASSSSVRGVPRRLTAYVGRLDRDTTEEDLSQFLKSSGIADPVCKKLKSKEGIVYRTAAFFVSCSSEWKHIFHNEDTWPAGCELRDWVWHDKR